MAQATFIEGKQITSGDEFIRSIKKFNRDNPPMLHQSISLVNLKITLSHYVLTWLYREGTINVQVNLMTVLTDLCQILNLSEKDQMYILGTELAVHPDEEESEMETVKSEKVMMGEA